MLDPVAKYRQVKVLLCSIICLFQSCLGGEVEKLKPVVIEEIPRKHIGFTQGFFILDGKLYESTGLYGKSKIRRIDLKTQELEISKDLPKHIFAEGLTPIGDGQMIQLSWQAKTGIVYDRDKLNISKVFKYETEGWGITSKGKEIVMSDGSNLLYFLDPETYQVSKKVPVTRDGNALEDLNELEWVGDFIYANVWMTDEIVKIAPKTGHVIATIDCSALLPDRPRNEDAVLNGIAYNFDEKVFYLTGKLWPMIYKVRFE